MNRLVIITVAFNFLILTGIGHGIIFLGLVAIFGLNGFIQGQVNFSLTGEYHERLFAAAAIAAVGQILLIVAYFVKFKRQKVIYLGLFILLFSYFILTLDFFNSTLDRLSFWTGTPFLISAVLLLVKTIKNHRLTVN